MDAEHAAVVQLVDRYQTSAGRSTTDAVAYLPPDLRQLITQTQIAVCSAVLSQRT